MSEAEEKEKQEGALKSDSPLVHSQVIDLLVANVIPTTKYFESRFDFLQHQINELREGQRHLEDSMNHRFEQAYAHVQDFKNSVDKRFEQVDKRFEQIIASIVRLTDQLEHRDERQRNFTLRMFTISVTLSFLGVLGVLLKILGII